VAGLYLSCTRHWRSRMLPWFSPTGCYPQSTPLVTESAATPRTHPTQAQKMKNNRKKKRKRTIAQLLGRDHHTLNPCNRKLTLRSLLCAFVDDSFTGWIFFLLLHWQSVLSKRGLITLWSLLCASVDLSFTGWRACSSPTDNPCCPSEAYFHLLRIMCFSFFLFFQFVNLSYC
jgi:hypothetical protein